MVQEPLSVVCFLGTSLIYPQCFGPLMGREQLPLLQVYLKALRTRPLKPSFPVPPPGLKDSTFTPVLSLLAKNASRLTRYRNCFHTKCLPHDEIYSLATEPGNPQTHCPCQPEQGLTNKRTLITNDQLKPTQLAWPPESTTPRIRTHSILLCVATHAFI